MKTNFPDLPPIGLTLLETIQKAISIEKAITFDGLCHEFFKQPR